MYDVLGRTVNKILYKQTIAMSGNKFRTVAINIKN